MKKINVDEEIVDLDAILLKALLTVTAAFVLLVASVLLYVFWG